MRGYNKRKQHLQIKKSYFFTSGEEKEDSVTDVSPKKKDTD